MMHDLPKELQTHLERGLKLHAPTLSPVQHQLSATMSVQLFKAVLPLVLRAEEAERNLLVRELKTVLQRYLGPDYQKDHKLEQQYL